MRKLLAVLIGFAAMGAVAGWLPQDRAQAQEQLSPLTVTDEVSTIHVFPTVNGATALVRPALDLGPLVYHSGGPIMPSVTTYAIFWVPPKLQNGASTSMSVHYQAVQRNLLTDYPGHGLDNNNTQYTRLLVAKRPTLTTPVHLAVLTSIPPPIRPRIARTLTRQATASPTFRSRRKSRR